MKKLLAMVLALVMTLSLATVSSNAAFKDADKVDETYAEAVEVLNGLKVFQGYEDGSFNPTGNITRAEVAAIVYRVYTTDVKDTYVKNYETYNKFSDMSGAGWAKGYIGYCANAEFVKGYPDGTFQPSGNVTGYEVLAMILRAVGYDKNGEFTGADWALHVAQIAEQAGVLTNVKGIDLNKPATREVVAELLFQAIQIPMVTYTAAFGYQNVSLTGGTSLTFKDNVSLGYQNFKLKKDATTEDAWGRPATVWFKDSDGDLKYDNSESVYATVAIEPDASFEVATSECDICEALSESKQAKVTEVYVNGENDSAAAKALVKNLSATATKATVGAQGQQIEFYALTDEDGDTYYREVIVDTYLAKVADVVAEKTDSKGHVTRDDYLKLNVYKTNSTGEEFYVAGNDYAEGDYILVNVNENTKNNVSFTGVSYGDAKKNLVEVVGKAESFEGAQTKIYYSSNKHVIDGTDYNDAETFFLGKDVTSNVKHTWFLDQFGNLIGAADIDNTSYAVLKSIYWTGSERNGYAEAVLVGLDGEETTATVKSIDGINTSNATVSPAPAALSGAFQAGLNDRTPKLSDSSVSGTIENSEDGYAYVSTWDNYNKAYNGMALFLVETNDDGSVNLQGYQKVSYDTKATLNKDSSVLTIDSDSAGNSAVDTTYALSTNTKFIVREGSASAGYTYNTSYTLRTLPSWVDETCEVYYVVESGSSYATTVYVKSAVSSSEFGKYIFVPEFNYSCEYDVATRTTYMKLFVDGVERMVEITSDGGSNDVAANVACLRANEGKLLEVANAGTFWEITTTEADFGAIQDASNAAVVTESNDNTNWSANNVLADYITYCEFDSANTVVVSKSSQSTVENIIDLADAKIVYANGDVEDATYELVKAALDGTNGVWAVTKKTAYQGAAAYLFVGTKLETTAAAAKTALDNANFSGSKISITDDNETDMESKAIALAEKKLDAAGITGVTVTITGDPSAPTLGTNGSVSFTFEVTDSKGSTETTNALAITVYNNYSTTSLSSYAKAEVKGADINNHGTSCTNPGAMTIEKAETAISNAIKAISGCSGATVEVTVVEKSGTVGSGATATVTVTATGTWTSDDGSTVDFTVPAIDKSMLACTTAHT